MTRRSRRGQAMLEYSFVSFVVLIGASAGAWVYWSTLMTALDLYFQSLYFVITSPVP
jgi:hypothetical protein